MYVDDFINQPFVKRKLSWFRYITIKISKSPSVPYTQNAMEKMYKEEVAASNPVKPMTEYPEIFLPKLSLNLKDESVETELKGNNYVC